MDGAFPDGQAAALGHAAELRDAAAERRPRQALASGLTCPSAVLADLTRLALSARLV